MAFQEPCGLLIKYSYENHYHNIFLREKKKLDSKWHRIHKRIFEPSKEYIYCNENVIREDYWKLNIQLLGIIKHLEMRLQSYD